MSKVKELQDLLNAIRHDISKSDSNYLKRYVTIYYERIANGKESFSKLGLGIEVDSGIKEIYEALEVLKSYYNNNLELPEEVVEAKRLCLVDTALALRDKITDHDNT